LVSLLLRKINLQRQKAVSTIALHGFPRYNTKPKRIKQLTAFFLGFLAGWDLEVTVFWLLGGSMGM